MRKRGFLNIPFQWLFAIIAGTVILFLAIYMAVQFMDIGKKETDTKTAKNIGVLLNALELGPQTLSKTQIEFPVETRIYNDCKDYKKFGRQEIKVSQKSFDKWSSPSVPISIQNRYLFSESRIQGKEFIIFEKPFYFPFKIADLIYLIPTTEEYCLKNPPFKIQTEISNLRTKNIKVTNCSENSIKICFSSDTDCDIKVSYDSGSYSGESSGYVEKNSKMYFYTDALMYAAIFSDENTYECQLKRLIGRVEQLTMIYREKTNIISSTVGCSNNLQLTALEGMLTNFQSSRDITSQLINIIEKIKENNNANTKCKLW